MATREALPYREWPKMATREASTLGSCCSASTTLLAPQAQADRAPQSSALRGWPLLTSPIPPLVRPAPLSACTLAGLPSLERGHRPRRAAQHGGHVAMIALARGPQGRRPAHPLPPPGAGHPLGDGGARRVGRWLGFRLRRVVVGGERPGRFAVFG